MQPAPELEAAVLHRFAGVLRGRVHPVDVARRFLSSLNEGMRETPSGPVAPNNFTLCLSNEDMEHMEPFLADLSAEFQRCVADVAAGRGLRLLGPPVVRVQVGDGLAPGQFEVRSLVSEPPAQPSLPGEMQAGE